MQSHHFYSTRSAPKRRRKLWKIFVPVLVLFAIFYGVFVYASLGALADLPLARVMGFPFSGKSYLVIFQNDAERRPTGGFISAYGTLRFRLGIFPTLDFGNVYDPKLIQPETKFPDPDIAKLLAGPNYPGHGFRDGNGDPDFPTSAKELIRLYRLGYPDAEFHGVIALDFTAFAHLVDAVGGVTLDEREFFGDGLFFALEELIQNIDVHNVEALAERKNILGILANKLIKKILFSPTRYSDVTASVEESLRAKHVQLFFFDVETENVAREKNWAGALPFSATGDSLLLVEGNYGGMKSSRYVTRELSYEVGLEEEREAGGGRREDELLKPTTNDQQPTTNSDSGIPNTKYQILNTRLTATAHLKLHLVHRGDDAPPISGYYKSVWRLYTPLGTELVSGRPLRSFSDGAHQIFTFFLDLNPGEERTLDVRYRLPASVITNDVYSLALTRSAGSAEDSVSVIVKAPSGYLFEGRGTRDEGRGNEELSKPTTNDQQPTTNSDSEILNTKYQIPNTSFDLRENLAMWSGALIADQILSFKILPDTTPPRLADQAFANGLDAIDLFFAEPIDPASLATAYFSLTDLNVRSRATDTIQILGAKLISPRVVRLTLSGVTEVCREQYRLDFSGVADTHGNILTQKTATVVQTGEKCEG